VADVTQHGVLEPAGNVLHIWHAATALLLQLLRVDSVVATRRLQRTVTCHGTKRDTAKQSAGLRQGTAVDASHSSSHDATASSESISSDDSQGVDLFSDERQ
jgi:hypothetical protein